MRRWAIAHQLAHPTPTPRPPASARRWQGLKISLKIGALWQLDATPHRWFPGDQKHYPLLNLLDDCSRVCIGATIYHAEYASITSTSSRPPSANTACHSNSMSIATVFSFLSAPTR